MKTKKKDVLPDLPSKLLKVALIDLMTVERRKKKYDIDMGTWAELSKNTKCQVCHAGAVMVCTLKDQFKEDEFGLTLLDPVDFPKKTEAKLRFINQVRVGQLFSGMKDLRKARVLTSEQFKAANKALGPGIVDAFTDPFGYPSGGKDALHIPISVRDYEGKENREAYKNYIQTMIGILRAEGL